MTRPRQVDREPLRLTGKPMRQLLLSFLFVRPLVKTVEPMAQHLKHWYREHRDRDRPASEAMEPSDKLEGQSKDWQRKLLGYAIAPSWMDRNETSKVGGVMMHDSLTAATRAVNGARGEARNVT